MVLYPTFGSTWRLFEVHPCQFFRIPAILHSTKYSLGPSTGHNKQHRKMAHGDYVNLITMLGASTAESQITSLILALSSSAECTEPLVEELSILSLWRQQLSTCCAKTTRSPCLGPWAWWAAGGAGEAARADGKEKMAEERQQEMRSEKPLRRASFYIYAVFF